MPIIVPPFVQYQAPLPPLRGLWHSKPPEGDRFVTAEIEWGITTPPANAVQFSLSGNSPLAITQICAFNVDNTHCGADVQFLFPDSGSRLVIPAYNQGLYPVFTNALMFYVFSPSASTGDLTIFSALNSIPPPVQVEPSAEQLFSSFSGLLLGENTLPPGMVVIPAPINGTLQSFSITTNALSPSDGGNGGDGATFALADGLGHIIWLGRITPATTTPIIVSGLHVRFYDGLYIQNENAQPPASGVNGLAIVNVYYSVP